MQTLLSIAFFVLGVLQIILLVKIWIMTNDVKEIKEAMTAAPITPQQEVDMAKVEMLMGNKEKAIEMFKREFMIEVLSLYNNTKSNFRKETMYMDEYSAIERKFKERIGTECAFINFEAYSTLEKAKAIFEE